MSETLDIFRRVWSMAKDAPQDEERFHVAMPSTLGDFVGDAPSTLFGIAHTESEWRGTRYSITPPNPKRHGRMHDVAGVSEASHG